MSEYQYYEFLAIDRPLTAAEKDKVREFSTRADITATSFVNEYHWGNFRGSPEEFLRLYFDAMVYVTNWGTHQFMFRLPKDVVNIASVEPYCTQEILTIKPVGKHYLFDFSLNDEEGGDDEDASGLMASLAGLRAEVSAGDYRPLYLAWLAELQLGGIDESEPEPPVPPGLSKLSASQKSLADFLQIEGYLIRLAAATSPKTAEPDFDPVAALAKIPVTEKDRWLLDLIENPDPHAAMRLRLKLQAAATPTHIRSCSSSTRTAGHLYNLWQEKSRELDELERQANEAKRRKEAAELAVERERHLDALARNTGTAWKNIDQLVGLKTLEGYRQAVELLTDLKAVSQRPAQDPAAFQRLLGKLVDANKRKASFVQLLHKAGL